MMMTMHTTLLVGNYGHERDSEDTEQQQQNSPFKFLSPRSEHSALLQPVIDSDTKVITSCFDPKKIR